MIDRIHAASPSRNRPGLSVFIAIVLLLGISLVGGCASVPVYEQVELSQPGMLFSDSPALADSGSIVSTLEPGTDQRGGASASGCTACQ